MKSIYEYLDYTLFLKEYIESEKEKKPYFSYRYLAEKIGVDASNIAKVVAGKRHLSKSAVTSLATLCRFNKRELQYFTALMELSRTEADDDREKIIQKLAKIKTVQPYTIEEPQYEYYSKWYHSAILALLYFFDFKDDYHFLASKLEPTITPEEAQRSIDLLFQLNLVRRDESGILRHTQNLISTGEKWRSLAIATFQRETLNLALRSLDHHSSVERDISTLTVTASRDDILKIKEITARYRKDVLRIIEESEQSEAVYQLNIQLFPLTRRIRQ